MRVAFVHDWLGTYRGGEKVLEALLGLYPTAPIYTLFYEKGRLPDSITRRRIITPRGFGKWFSARKALLPFLPAAIESLNLNQFDLIISSSSCVAKGVVPAPHAKHLCYIHSPMRYAWDQRHDYLRRLRGLPFGELAAECVLSRLRQWDVQSCPRVDQFIANSNFVAERVRRYYGRESKVVHPLIEDRFFTSPLVPSGGRTPYLLCFGAMVPYKRFDLAIEAANRLRLELVVAGSGPEEQRLRGLAKGNVRFVSAPDDRLALQLLSEARGLVFPGVEDFGMIPVEAMAVGTPVVALASGGLLDSVQDGVNGVTFVEPTVESLADALRKFDQMTFVPENLRQSATRFSRPVFIERMRDQVTRLMQGDT